MNQNGVNMIKNHDEDIQKTIESCSTETLKAIVSELNKLANMASLDDLKKLGMANRNNYRLDDIVEKASKEIDAYTKEIERRENGNKTG
jgi:hypothetical protein